MDKSMYDIIIIDVVVAVVMVLYDKVVVDEYSLT